MSVLTSLKKAERRVEGDKRREKANARYQEGQMKKVFRACNTMIREEIRPLRGRTINGSKLVVTKIKGGYKIFATPGFGYDPERTLEITTDTFTGSFRPADDCPEQDYTSHGIRIKWWRRGDRCNSDEMSDSVTLETGALDWDEEVAEKRKEFQDSLSQHILRCVGLN